MEAAIISQSGIGLLTEESYDELINKVIEGLKQLKNGSIEESCPIGIISMDNWEWPQGVGLFSLYLYYKKTQKQEILDYLTAWFDMNLAKGVPPKNVNTMCPMLTLTYLYEETGNPRYLAECKEWISYAMEEMPRTEEMGIQHVVSGQLNEGELWDDTLYMTVLFIARMGVLLQDDRLIQESIRQFIVHIKYLTDVKTGLFFHGWTFVGNHHFAEALWARGNSWYTAGLVDYLELLDLGDRGGVQMSLISTLERQVSQLAELQHTSGMWHTLLTDPTSYLETSATAAFGYGILKAVRKGYISEGYRTVGMKALEAVVNSIDADGTVQGVSYGTGMGHTLQAYKDIPLCPMPYGQSMALLLLVEAMEHR